MKDIIQVILDYFETGGVTLVRSLTLILLGYIFIQTTLYYPRILRTAGSQPL